LYKPEYNICSFFRDFPLLQEKTFTKRTIKHSFKNAGVWPVSFKQVKRKIKEYGKKNAKDTRLAFLEFSREPDSSDSKAKNDKTKADLIPDP
jgi:hypothetical protein